MAFTKQAIRLARFGLDPAYDNATGNVKAAVATAHLQTKRLQNDADPEDAVESSWVPISFNLLDITPPVAPAVTTLKDTPITAAGKTVTHGELAALIRKACIDRANAQGIV